MTETKLVTQIKFFHKGTLEDIEKDVNEFCENHQVLQIISVDHNIIMVIYIKEIEIEIDIETGRRDVMYTSLRESINNQYDENGEIRIE